MALLILLTPGSLTAAGVRLPVAFHRQEHSLSCEVATLKMALAVHNIDVAESELIQNLPFDPTPKGGGVWGDPNKGFVGNINGSMLRTGYGVYWDPIAQVGNKYAATQVIRHGSASELARHLTAGNPVIIWGYFGQRAVYHWQTPAGETIKAVNGEHTRIVYGFDGTVQNPTRFYLIDPLTGYLSWSTEELMYNWSSLNHMGVVVALPPQWVRAAGETDIWHIDTNTNTRRLIATWKAFVRQTAGSATVHTIDPAQLLRYTRGADIQ